MKHHAALHMAVLLLMLGASAFVFYMVRPDRTLQMIVGILMAAGYVLWGIVHHVMEGDLHPRLVIEYVLVGVIALVLLFTMAL